MIWNEQYECMPVEELKTLQLKRLRETVERVYHKVPYYRKKMDALKVKPADIQKLGDLTKLPFMIKKDLRDNYPYGLFTVPLREIVRLQASSGTTGKPTVVGYTKGDLERWSELMARSLVSAGADHDALVQNAFSYGLFTGGLGVHYGAERIGASIIPISVGKTKRQVMMMQEFGATMLASTPSYALHLAEAMEEMDIDQGSLALKTGVFGAEPWSDNMRREIEHNLGIKAYDLYGLSEIMGPGVSCECEVQNGLHINEDHFIAEIIDPLTGEVLPAGQYGELVLTTLTKEAVPLIRYRSRDISMLLEDSCPCGRTHLRMARVTGRSDDMLIIRGINVFPSQIESVLLEIAEIEPHYLLVVDRVGNLDTLEVMVEISDKMFSDEMKKLDQMEKRINRALESSLGIAVKVRLVEPKTIERSETKAKRVVDLRKF